VQFKDRVQFWTTGNYHYYLKQELPVVIDPEIQSLFAFKWHQEKALRFVTGSSGMTINSLLR
jgi:elongator complex protein 1